jgi:hypothetical protein
MRRKWASPPFFTPLVFVALYDTITCSDFSREQFCLLTDCHTEQFAPNIAGQKHLGKQRINSIEELNVALSAWEIDRNKRQKSVNWQFTTEDARVKLKRLYPTPLFE